MNEEMLERLARGEDPIDVSIQKWVDGKEYLESVNEDSVDWVKLHDMLLRWDNCALCYRYYSRFGERCCMNCPICRATYRPYCKGTPFKNVEYHISHKNFYAVKTNVDNEIKFLESLKVKK